MGMPLLETPLVRWGLLPHICQWMVTHGILANSLLGRLFVFYDILNKAQ